MDNHRIAVRLLFGFRGHGNSDGQKGLDRLQAANVKNVSLTTFDCVAKIAAGAGYIAPGDVDRLIRFRNNPSDESWRN